MKRLSIAVALGWLVAGPAIAAPEPAKTTAAAEPDCTTGACGLDVLRPEERTEIEAVLAELRRGMAGLRLPDAPAPYLAEARWVRGDLLSLEGSYGGVITNVGERQTAGIVGVRVGSPERDSSNYFMGQSGLARLEVPLTPSGEYTKKRLWLSMDQAFRGATLSYSGKVAALEQVANKDLSPDLSAGAGAVVHVQTQPAAPIDRDGLAGLVGSLSARFADWPDIDNGDVHVQVLRSWETVVNTEGLVIRRARDRAVLAVLAETRADDGMVLDHGLVMHFQKAPAADDELLARGEKLADQVLAELRELRDAPMIEEEYDGPILLGPVAAAQLLASTVATEAAGDPAPWGDMGRIVELEPAWHKRVGKTVLPPFLDLVDDPTREGFGAFSFDAEGFVPGPVTLVKDGKLEALLMTRTPNDKVAGSNGRARMSPALEIGPALSNLSLVSKERGSSARALERELLRRAQEDGYEFGYVIESLRDGTILGPVPRESAAAYAGTGKLNLPLPGRVYRVDKDGTRTLERGAILAPASMRVLRRIRVLGQDATAIALRIPVGGFGGFSAEVGIDGVLSQTVDVEITTPSMLVEGLELLVERGDHEELPTLTHPLRRAPAEPAQ